MHRLFLKNSYHKNSSFRTVLFEAIYHKSFKSRTHSTLCKRLAHTNRHPTVQTQPKYTFQFVSHVFEGPVTWQRGHFLMWLHCFRSRSAFIVFSRSSASWKLLIPIQRQSSLTYTHVILQLRILIRVCVIRECLCSDLLTVSRFERPSRKPLDYKSECFFWCCRRFKGKLCLIFFFGFFVKCSSLAFSLEYYTGLKQLCG